MCSDLNSNISESLLTAKRSVMSGHEVYGRVIVSGLSVQSESGTVLVYAIETVALLELVPRVTRHS